MQFDVAIVGGGLTGAVLRMAHRSGLPVPVHEDIAGMIAARGLLR